MIAFSSDSHADAAFTYACKASIPTQSTSTLSARLRREQGRSESGSKRVQPTTRGFAHAMPSASPRSCCSSSRKVSGSSPISSNCFCFSLSGGPPVFSLAISRRVLQHGEMMSDLQATLICFKHQTQACLILSMTQGDDKLCLVCF